jgi:hypothetical protein
MNPQARTRMLARADYLRATHRMTWGEVARAVGWVGPLWRRPGTEAVGRIVVEADRQISEPRPQTASAR